MSGCHGGGGVGVIQRPFSEAELRNPTPEIVGDALIRQPPSVIILFLVLVCQFAVVLLWPFTNAARSPQKLCGRSLFGLQGRGNARPIIGRSCALPPWHDHITRHCSFVIFHTVDGSLSFLTKVGPVQATSSCSSPFPMFQYNCKQGIFRVQNSVSLTPPLVSTAH